MTNVIKIDVSFLVATHTTINLSPTEHRFLLAPPSHALSRSFEARFGKVSRSARENARRNDTKRN